MRRERGLDIFTRSIVSLSLVWSHLPVNSVSAYKDYLTLDHNCTEVLPPVQSYDAIFVFGAGTYKDKRGVEYPNSYQRGRLEAAATLFAKDYSEVIILVGSGDENSIDVTMQILKNRVDKLSRGTKEFKKRHLKVIPSISTAEDIKQIKSYLEENGLKSGIGVSDIFHLDRLELLSSNNDVEIDFGPTECVAERYYPEASEGLTHRNQSPEMSYMISQEKLAMAVINLFDHNGEKSMRWKRFVTGKNKK